MITWIKRIGLLSVLTLSISVLFTSALQIIPQYAAASNSIVPGYSNEQNLLNGKVPMQTTGGSTIGEITNLTDNRADTGIQFIVDETPGIIKYNLSYDFASYFVMDYLALPSSSVDIILEDFRGDSYHYEFFAHGEPTVLELPNIEENMVSIELRFNEPGTYNIRYIQLFPTRDRNIGFPYWNVAGTEVRMPVLDGHNIISIDYENVSLYILNDGPQEDIVINGWYYDTHAGELVFTVNRAEKVSPLDQVYFQIPTGTITAVQGYRFPSSIPPPVEFPAAGVEDPAFREFIYNFFGSDATITTRLMEELPYNLDLDNLNITSLNGIEYATQIERLSLRGNSITDLSSLSYLHNLSSLHLDDMLLENGQAINLAPLVDLNYLEVVTILGENYIPVNGLDLLRKHTYVYHFDNQSEGFHLLNAYWYANTQRIQLVFSDFINQQHELDLEKLHFYIAEIPVDIASLSYQYGEDGISLWIDVTLIEPLADMTELWVVLDEFALFTTTGYSSYEISTFGLQKAMKGAIHPFALSTLTGFMEGAMLLDINTVFPMESLSENALWEGLSFDLVIEGKEGYISTTQSHQTLANGLTLNAELYGVGLFGNDGFEPRKRLVYNLPVFIESNLINQVGVIPILDKNHLYELLESYSWFSIDDAVRYIRQQQPQDLTGDGVWNKMDVLLLLMLIDDYTIHSFPPVH